MRSAFLHVLRYFGWALIGAAFGLGTLFVWCERGENYIFTPGPELLVPSAILGALVLVPIRAGVGAISGAESARADCVTAVYLGQFLLGGVAGWLAADFVRGFVPLGLFLNLNNHGWWLLPLVLAGASAGVATGWLARRRHGRILFPVAWTGVFALLVAGWFNLVE
jgi:hypothetical protein